MHRMKKESQTHSRALLGVLAAVLLGTFLVAVVVLNFAFPAFRRERIRNFATRAGEAAGLAAGKAVTSQAQGRGQWSAGYEDGSYIFNAAQPTLQHIRSRAREAGQVQVLVAGVTLYPAVALGDARALPPVKGEAVFTIDFAQAYITHERGKSKMQVELPPPRLQLRLAEQPQPIAQAWGWDPTGHDLDAALQAMAQDAQLAARGIADYRGLCSEAEAAAQAMTQQILGTHYNGFRLVIKEREVQP